MKLDGWKRIGVLASVISFLGWGGHYIATRSDTFHAIASTNPAWSNSCSNVDVIGSFDRSGLRENEYGIQAAGTFRIEGESDEHKQPMFNLSSVDCEKPRDQSGRPDIACKVTKAVVWADGDKPDSYNPNCSLDLDVSEYSMKEMAPGVLTGTAESGICYNSFLTIDRNSNRVYMTFTKTQSAQNAKLGKLDMCASTPKTEVLMNCTAWARSRQKSQTPSTARYCDFSSAGDK